MAPVVQALQGYVTKFEIHNEPNHVQGIEGWGATDKDARDFSVWYMHVLNTLRPSFPWARFGFPGLALNWPHRDLEWLSICQEAVRASDWLGCHCYWQYGNMLDPEWGLRFQAYRLRFPDKRLEITEFGDSTPGLSPETMAREYVQYYEALQPYSYLGSASAFIASSPDPQWAPFCWMTERGEMRPVVAAVGARPIHVEHEIVNLVGTLKMQGAYPTRSPSTIKCAVLHHSGTPTMDTIGSELRVKRIHDFHKRVYHWAGIGYHYVIAGDGTIYKTEPETVVSNHAGGWIRVGSEKLFGNANGIGVCLLGTYTATEPPRAQLAAAAWLVKKLGLPLHDHRPFGGTVCPGIAGDALRRYMEV
jgi:hypothetical protein